MRKRRSSRRYRSGGWWDWAEFIGDLVETVVDILIPWK